MSLPPSMQYIFLQCGTNNDHNDPGVISDGLINVASYKEKIQRCKNHY